jgi:hypothetical protein
LLGVLLVVGLVLAYLALASELEESAAWTS